ncbi:hypothetical protein C8N24_0320 [Solirubrobacter pauli]|uniref:Uncharacterized protein n=1 Tax=Solirubrobacter pauli TaxID=166793 RepID=A0A660L8C4_9ACTN|nr:hypothetical protein [Solirubrobacter pauli]RKQ90515.1 hypothetical protein C8N24_0320 [Solirubrobacter pauli]
MIDPRPLTRLMIAVGRQRHAAQRVGQHAAAVWMHPDTLEAMDRLREACYPGRTVDDVFSLRFEERDDVAPGSFRLALTSTPAPARAPSAPDGGPPEGPVTATLTERAL